MMIVDLGKLVIWDNVECRIYILVFEAVHTKMALLKSSEMYMFAV